MAFDYQPTLEGHLIKLRPLEPEDYADLYAVASDPLIWAQHPAPDRHEEANFLTFFEESLRSGGALLVTERSTERVIGSSRFYCYDVGNSEVEIGWTFLARSHWGGTYNGELKRLMLQHAFRFVSAVVLLVGPENHRSQRAVEKIGGIAVATRPDASGLQSVVYRITAGAFGPAT